MRRALIGGFVLAVTACGGGADKGGADTAAGAPATGAAPAAAPGAAGGGTVSGSIAFDGAPPANPPIDMAAEAACASKHSSAPADPVVKVTGGKLANVVVYVKSGLPAGQTYPVPTTPAVIDQQGCLYQPRALAAMVGQNVEIKNSDPVLHNIKAVPTKNRGFNISQPREGMTTTRTFTVEEISVPLECNVHGWMHANVSVFTHPFFAVSKDDGSFTIGGLPAGTYEIEARHEKLGTKTMSVTVPENGAGTANFSFSAAAS
jgi:plastocyanin